MTPPSGRSWTGGPPGRSSACGTTGMIPPGWKLEKKFKVNGLCGKRSARLSREEGERLAGAGELDFLLEREEPLLAELYHKLRGDSWPPGRRCVHAGPAGRGLFKIRPVPAV